MPRRNGAGYGVRWSCFKAEKFVSLALSAVDIRSIVLSGGNGADCGYCSIHLISLALVPRAVEYYESSSRWRWAESIAI